MPVKTLAIMKIFDQCKAFPFPGLLIFQLRKNQIVA